MRREVLVGMLLVCLVGGMIPINISESTAIAKENSNLPKSEFVDVASEHIDYEKVNGMVKSGSGVSIRVVLTNISKEVEKSELFFHSDLEDPVWGISIDGSPKKCSSPFTIDHKKVGEARITLTGKAPEVKKRENITLLDITQRINGEYSVINIKKEVTSEAIEETITPMPTPTEAPMIMHDPSWVVGYYNIPLSICVGIKDNIYIKRCSIYYKIGGSSNYEHIEMIEHSNVVHEGYTLYEATIPASDVVLEGLEYYFKAENIGGGITKTIAYHPHLEFLKLYDSYPALNREGHPYEVKLLRKVPKLWGIIGSGTDTNFEGNKVPGYLWVPVELSDNGLYTMIDQYPFHFKDYEARKATYKEVLLHMLLQDDLGLAADFEDFLERLSGDTETMATFGEVGGKTGRDIANNLIESLKQGNTKLSRDELLFLSRHLHSPNNYAGVSKRLADLLDDIESRDVVRKVSIVSLSSKITGDAIRTLRYWCAAQEATSRIDAFKKTNYYNKNPGMDPALRDAIEEVLKEIEQMQDNRDIVRAFQTAADKAIDVTDYIVNAGTIVTSLGGQVPSWLTPYLIGGKVIWDDVFKEANTLKLLIAAATLEKTFHENAITVVKDKNDVYLLLQMKYYLGYYYANLFLSLKGKWTILAADFVGSCFMGREKMSERFDQMEVSKNHCIEKYREFEVTSTPTPTITPTLTPATPPDVNEYIPELIDEFIAWWTENKDELFKAAHEFVNEMFKAIDELISEYQKEK